VLRKLIDGVLCIETSGRNGARAGQRTIVATEKHIPVTICHCSIYILLGLFKGGDVDVLIKARQYA
jgi:hypothetical protein